MCKQTQTLCVLLSRNQRLAKTKLSVVLDALRGRGCDRLRAEIPERVPSVRVLPCSIRGCRISEGRRLGCQRLKCGSTGQRPGHSSSDSHSPLESWTISLIPCAGSARLSGLLFHFFEGRGTSASQGLVYRRDPLCSSTNRYNANSVVHLVIGSEMIKRIPNTRLAWLITAHVRRNNSRRVPLRRGGSRGP